MSHVTDTIRALVLDLLEWVSSRRRSYEETIDAWRTSCPRLQVWEEATDLELIAIEASDRRPVVTVTPAGRAFLTRYRPEHGSQ